MVLFALVFVVLVVLAKAQDPQDIATIACASSTSIYEFTSSSGYIESPGYPDTYYEDNEDCQWYINPSGGIPEGTRLFIEIVDFITESCCDDLSFHEGRGTSGNFLFEISGIHYEGEFFTLANDPVTLWFNTDSSIEFDGFRVYFYVGELSPGQVVADQACDADTRPVTLNNSTAILESLNYPSEYPSSTYCEWIIAPPDFINGIYLNVLYFYAYDYLYVYFDGVIDPGNHDDYFYGSLYTGVTIYSPGNTVALRFEGEYEDPGFQVLYFQADPACTTGSATVINVDQKAELISPGHPYDVPEHLSCRWLLQAPAGQKVLLTSLAMDLYGDSFDCEDEYVEVLDGKGFDALSLGLFCGNMSFGTIPSTSDALQVYLRTTEDDSTIFMARRGFRFEYELN